MIMIHFIRNVMLLLIWLMLSLIGLNIVSGQSIDQLKRVRVEIFNGLVDGLDLTLHCKSGMRILVPM
jgi:hypothetical protein